MHSDSSQPVPAAEFHGHFAYWTAGSRLRCDGLFDIYPVRPAAATHQRFDYVLTTPAHGLRGTGYQVAIDKIATRAAAAALSHPTIVPLIDAELDRPPFFWVEPLFSHPTLESFFHVYSSPVSTAVWIIRQIVQAVCHAHEHMRTLSGLAPGQIQVADSGRVLIGALQESVPFGHPLDLFSGLPVRQARYATPPAIQAAQVEENEKTPSPAVELGIHHPDHDVFPPQAVRVVAASPRHDLAKVGRIIHWMLARTVQQKQVARPDCLTSSPFSVQRASALSDLKRLAEQAVSDGNCDRPADADLSRRLLDQLANCELEHVANDSLFGY